MPPQSWQPGCRRIASCQSCCRRTDWQLPGRQPPARVPTCAVPTWAARAVRGRAPALVARNACERAGWRGTRCLAVQLCAIALKYSNALHCGVPLQPNSLHAHSPPLSTVPAKPCGTAAPPARTPTGGRGTRACARRWARLGPQRRALLRSSDPADQPAEHFSISIPLRPWRFYFRNFGPLHFNAGYLCHFLP